MSMLNRRKNVPLILIDDAICPVEQISIKRENDIQQLHNAMHSSSVSVITEHQITVSFEYSSPLQQYLNRDSNIIIIGDEFAVELHNSRLYRKNPHSNDYTIHAKDETTVDMSQY